MRGLCITAEGLKDATNVGTEDAPFYVLTARQLLQNDWPDPEQVAVCKAWLTAYAKPKKGWGARTSYGLKHVVERWAGAYVTNGAFIEAAAALGYDYRRASPGSPNAVFRMALPRKRSPAWYASRLDGTRAQEGGTT